MLWYKYDGCIIFAPQMIGAILHELRQCSWTRGKTPEASVSHFSILLEIQISDFIRIHLIHN